MPLLRKEIKNFLELKEPQSEVFYKSMKKIMISQPMNGKKKEEILEIRNAAKEYLESQGYEVVDSYFSEMDPKSLNEIGVVHHSVYYLAEALGVMSRCDGVYFCKGWETARGCVVENYTAVKYGLKVMYEE